MPDIPRRLPPTADERLSVVVSRMAGGSSAGATRWAQPVNGESYRPATALNPPPDIPASTAPLLAVLGQGQVVTYDGFNPDTFHDVFALDGLIAGRIYLMETVVLASNADPGGGPSSVRLQYVGPPLDTGTSQFYVDTASGTAAQLNSYAPFDMDTYDAETQGVTVYYTQCLIGVSPWADPTNLYTLQALGLDPAANAVVHPATFIRATDIGPVPTIS